MSCFSIGKGRRFPILVSQIRVSLPLFFYSITQSFKRLCLIFNDQHSILAVQIFVLIFLWQSTGILRSVFTRVNNWRQRGLVVSALDSQSGGPGFRPGHYLDLFHSSIAPISNPQPRL